MLLSTTTFFAIFLFKRPVFLRFVVEWGFSIYHPRKVGRKMIIIVHDI